MADEGHPRGRRDEGDTLPERAGAAASPAPAEPPPISVGVVLADRYELRKVIGRGGMGLVLEAYDRVLRAPVAIKIVRPEYAGERQWAERLAREVKLARQIHHPHVCRVFDFEQAAGRVFLVMELATEGTLRDELASGAVAARPLAARLADARAVAEGLTAIHTAGIIHRDLSPQNLLRMSDGRLVISDFGLAIDTFESATSIRGGTVAYMAPEIVRGGAVSFAADVWSLGVVLHETVFGQRPRWSEPGGGEMLDPVLGRRLEPAERGVLDICRACTEWDPARRPKGALEVAARLESGGGRRLRLGRRARTALLTVCAAISGAAAFAQMRRSIGEGPWAASALARPNPTPPKPEEYPLIVPIGDPEDWTRKARVMVEVSGLIDCLRALPDGHTVRFVWGTLGGPRHAEDLDLATGRRGPSPLVPEAYGIGCPALSPDGRRLLYEGRTPDGRPFAFVSPTPDGRNAEAMVETAEPSMSSDPLWLPDADAFTYEMDIQNMGAFAVSTRRLTRLPRPTSQALESSFHYSGDAGPIVEGATASGAVSFAYLSWPSLRVLAGFRVGEFLMDVSTRGRTTFYCIERGTGPMSALSVVDFERKIARRLGALPGAGIVLRYPVFTPGGVAFVRIKIDTEVILRGPSGAAKRIAAGAMYWSATACGRDILVVREQGAHVELIRLSRTGQMLEDLGEFHSYFAPACTSDGRSWYMDDGGGSGLKRCDRMGCQHILAGPTRGVSVSPDGERLLLLTVGERGPVVEWVPANGGKRHLVANTESVCPPGWSGRDTVWVSRQERGRRWWEERNVETGTTTGKVLPGLRNCMDSIPDPLSPVSPEVQAVEHRQFQIRFVPRDVLPEYAR